MFTAPLLGQEEIYMPKEEPLMYISSKGEVLSPDEIHLARFGNAIRMIEREGAINPNFENLARLKEVFERRQKEWDAAHPDQAPIR